MAIEAVVDEQPGERRPAPACNDGTGGLTELFFSEDLHDIARAKHLCGTCACAAHAWTQRSPARSPVASGVVSCCPRGGYWPTSAGGAAHPSDGRPR